MRIIALAAVCFSSLAANPYFETDPGNMGAGALLLWPTARSTALAGAMTGLADEADAACFNPAGLAFQATAKADITYANNWLPGLYPGVRYASAFGGVPIRVPCLRDHQIFVCGSAVYLTTGETDIVNERGEFLGRVTTWRGTAGLHLAMLLTKRFGAGISLKALHDSRHDWGWYHEQYAEGTGAAADIAVLYRPLARLSIGAAVANLGPRIVYRPDGETRDLPRLARIGACWTADASHDFSLRIMPELDKLLVGMFYDTTGTKTLGRKLDEEWKDVWKAVGIEATVLNVVSLRFGYFEDLTSQRGGIVMENEDGVTYHYGMWDALTRKSLGRLERIGLCWGFGVGTDKLRFDFSSDAAIYDFPTSNWKLQLTCNNIGRLLGVRS